MEILFIQTGGTIDKDYPRAIGGYGFEILNPAVEKILATSNPFFEYKIVTIFRKDSQEITEEDRLQLLNYCKDAEQKFIIVTHGTDTMIQTGLMLNNIHGKTIILTGAMKPERFKDSDASFNVGMAVGVMPHLSPGVYIAMHGRVIEISTVKRNQVTGMFTENA